MSTRTVYRQVEANVLSSGSLSADTVPLLQRYDLDVLATDQPGEALVQLHQKAVESGERDLLFALSELSYLAGERVRRSVKSWEERDARDYYLGAAVYAYLFLFGDGDERPSSFDRRFRTACDLYNYGLGLALTEPRSTNGLVRILEGKNGKRRLPLGEIDLNFSADPSVPLDDFETFLIADRYRVRGLSVRNRTPGLGTPLIGVGRIDPGLRLRRSAPATVLLRLQNLTLSALTSTNATGSLELYSGFSTTNVTMGGVSVPLERDLTTARAYTLNQSDAWRARRVQFFSPFQGLASQIIRSEPYRPGRIPVVLVHGTFSSPVKWGEMLNTLNADPVLRERFQIWLFLYSSSKPILFSADELREALTSTIQTLDPEGKDAALRQMVVIGHSQGGLLTKLTATDTGDQLWRTISDKSLDDLEMTEGRRAEIRRYFFAAPLPFVRRVVFISTPHRGSFRAKGFVRKLTQRVVTMPGTVMQRTSDLLSATNGIKIPLSFQGKRLTSLDGMSPKNPILLTMAEIPVDSSVKAHSIIPVKGNGDSRKGEDGVVAYASAHVDYVESELVVRARHSCQGLPPTIEEVRRILHKHIAELNLNPLPGP